MNDPCKGEWFLTYLYDTPYKENQEEQWDYIRDLSEVVNIPWAVIGDLNITLNPDEKLNHAFSLSSSSITHKLREADLSYLGFSENPFTWTSNKHGTGRIKIRLDRALINSEWFLKYPDSSLSHVSQNGSDHTPILLQLYNNISVKDFLFANKLTNTRKQLSLWNKNTFGHIQRTITNLKDKLTSLQKTDSNGRNTNKVLQIEVVIAQWDEIESSFWRQQGKDKLFGEMDMNTKYHTRTNMRRSRNRIDSLLAPDDEDNTKLLQIPSEAEIFDTLMSMEAWTSPGPDGFPPGFYQTQWNTIKVDLIEMIQNFFLSGFILKQLNKTRFLSNS
ncbi:uncharacterized protein LOC113294563 [Papaver somniferum]|uniref:uncharacterized protein LOC113294563 n=1 Tax=Papaver somniferum TaxID=3469 RepID=UPI000E6F65E2|nr:uncharacterized protein LOC113294563 [Papaver somniferum]